MLRSEINNVLPKSERPIRRSSGSSATPRKRNIGNREFREIVFMFAIHNIERLCEPLCSVSRTPIPQSNYDLNWNTT